MPINFDKPIVAELSIRERKRSVRLYRGGGRVVTADDIVGCENEIHIVDVAPERLYKMKTVWRQFRICLISAAQPKSTKCMLLKVCKEFFSVGSRTVAGIASSMLVIRVCKGSDKENEVGVAVGRYRTGRAYYFRQHMGVGVGGAPLSLLP
ncbi:hypothetical protein EVAR_59827_1 [Eumeta japonica]|uniref:Uncharacterized protein n=1 Tax=Eumeta variegata TaxID=151549 RepID=A0A4C1ZD44_EUMVA|nr:hypothetical protein EVAR_59827_1 [Eumeta japonica]